jgi:predicted HTH domain antitoxin
MAFTVDMPKQVEQTLQSRWGDLPSAAKEALAIESYRQQKISIGFLAQMLGMGVIAAEGWLRARGVPSNYTEADLEIDREALDRVLGSEKE